MFEIDTEICEQGGGRVKVIACIGDPAVVKRILDHLEHRIESNQILPYTARALTFAITPDGS